MSSSVNPSLTLHEHSSWFTKFVECMFAGIAVVNVIIMFSQLLPPSILEKFGNKIFPILFLGQVAAGLLFGIFYSVYWHHKENKNAIDSGKRHAWFQGILRYWLAFEISTYGFAKILKTQFAQVYYRDDTIVGNLNGFDLTWNYFAHSYTLAVIIALMQIGGSILLLFRRTTLLAVLILIPVMVNIVLINLFYNISPGAFMNSVLFTLGLLYLLFLRWAALKPILFAPSNSLPIVKLGFLKTLFKFLAIGMAFGLIYYFTTKNPDDNLKGKWKVTELSRNNRIIEDNAWIADKFAWKNVYIENRARIVFCPNPYVYEMERSQFAKYEYDSSARKIKISILENGLKKDSMLISLNNYEGDKMEWNAVFKSDTLKMKLSRVKK